MLFERAGGGEGCPQGQLEWGPRAWDGGGGGVIGGVMPARGAAGSQRGGGCRAR